MRLEAIAHKLPSPSNPIFPREVYCVPLNRDRLCSGELRPRPLLFWPPTLGDFEFDASSRISPLRTPERLVEGSAPPKLGAGGGETPTTKPVRLEYRLRSGVLRPLNPPTLGDFEFGESSTISPLRTSTISPLRTSTKTPRRCPEGSAPPKLGAGGAKTRQRSQ